MKRTRFSMLALTAVAAVGVSLSSPPASGSPDRSRIEERVPTFTQFAASTYRDVDGHYIVNGDEALSTRHELRTYYHQLVGTSGQDGMAPLIVNTVGGADDVWDAGQVASMTYCVSDAFGADKADVVAALDEGAALWEAASSAVDFSYDASADADCTTANDTVLFSVEPTDSEEFTARAFFPSDSDADRNVLVNADSLLTASVPAGNIMGHEFGHTLGFRHEHTRPEAGTCFEDDSWRPLTPYDSASIMHYPQCNGSSTDLSFTASDGDGVRAVYGS
jgi:Dual-action HEIGH metallo-peptidase